MKTIELVGRKVSGFKFNSGNYGATNGGYITWNPDMEKNIGKEGVVQEIAKNLAFAKIRFSDNYLDFNYYPVSLIENHLIKS